MLSKVVRWLFSEVVGPIVIVGYLVNFCGQPKHLFDSLLVDHSLGFTARDLSAWFVQQLSPKLWRNQLGRRLRATPGEKGLG